MDQAIAKLTSGAADFDVFFPTSDRISRLAFGKILQPLNLDYIPNLKNVWPALQDPFYDKGSPYTVPYTIFTTGIGYRSRPARRLTPASSRTATTSSGTSAGGEDLPARRRVARRSRWRCCGTGSRPQHGEPRRRSSAAKNDLLDLNEGQREAVDGRLRQAARGAGMAAPGLVGQHDRRARIPAVRRGRVRARLLVPAGRRRRDRQRRDRDPPLGEEPRPRAPFLNFMLDEKNAYATSRSSSATSRRSSRSTRTGSSPTRVVPAEPAVGRHRESDFKNGFQELELSPDGQILWQNAWAEFYAGV